MSAAGSGTRRYTSGTHHQLLVSPAVRLHVGERMRVDDLIAQRAQAEVWPEKCCRKCRQRPTGASFERMDALLRDKEEVASGRLGKRA